MKAKNRYIDGYYLGASGAMVPTDMAMMTAKAQAYASNTNYLILVNRATCRVGIFNGRLGAWNMSKFWQCAPGAAATPTVSGTFKVQSRDIILIPVQRDVTGIHSFMEIICSIVYCITSVMEA